MNKAREELAENRIKTGGNLKDSKKNRVTYFWGKSRVSCLNKKGK